MLHSHPESRGDLACLVDDPSLQAVTARHAEGVVYAYIEVKDAACTLNLKYTNPLLLFIGCI